MTPIVIGSSISLSLGSEVILSSFLLSMLKLNVRRISPRLLGGDGKETDDSAVRIGSIGIANPVRTLPDFFVRIG